MVPKQMFKQTFLLTPQEKKYALILLVLLAVGFIGRWMFSINKGSDKTERYHQENYEF